MEVISQERILSTQIPDYEFPASEKCMFLKWTPYPPETHATLPSDNHF